MIIKSIYKFNNTYIISNFYDKKNPINMNKEIHIKKEDGSFAEPEILTTVFNNVEFSYFMTDTLENIYSKENNKKALSTYSLKEKNSNFKSKIDSDTYQKLIPSFQSLYKEDKEEIVEIQPLNLTITTNYDVDFDKEKNDAFNSSNLSKIKIKDYLKGSIAVEDSFSINNSIENPFSGYFSELELNHINISKILYFLSRNRSSKYGNFNLTSFDYRNKYYTELYFDIYNKPYNGETKFIYSRKKDGKMYADRRGRHVKDFRVVDSLRLKITEIPVIKGNSIESIIEQVEYLFEKLTLQR